MTYKKSPNNLISWVTRFDINTLLKKVQDIENQMTVDGFWDDQKQATSIMQELSEYKEKIDFYNDISNSINGVKDLIELCEMDESLLNEINLEFENLKKKMQ